MVGANYLTGRNCSLGKWYIADISRYLVSDQFGVNIYTTSLRFPSAISRYLVSDVVAML